MIYGDPWYGMDPLPLVGGGADEKPRKSLWGLLGQTWPARMAQSAYEAVKLPGDVYSGVTPMTPPGLRREDFTEVPSASQPNDEVIGRAADLAGLIMSGTFGSAPRGAIGAGPVRGIPKRETGISLDDFYKMNLQAADPYFVRWSKGPKYDLMEGAVSRDHVTGELHNGLSAISLGGDLSKIDILNYLNDYNPTWARGGGTKPHIYSGKVVGRDSDNAFSIKPIAYLGTVSDDAISFLSDPSNIRRMQLLDSIDGTKRALKYYARNGAPDYIPIHTPERLFGLLDELKNLGGKNVIIPNPFVVKHNLNYGG